MAPVTNIDDIDMTVSDNNVTTVNVGGGGGSPVPNEHQDSNLLEDIPNKDNKTPTKPSATIQISPDDDSPPQQRLPGDGQETTPEQLSDERHADNAQQPTVDSRQSLMNGGSQAGVDVNNKAKLTIDSTEESESNHTKQTDMELKPTVHGNDAGDASPSPTRSKSILKQDPPMKKFSGAPAEAMVHEGDKKKDCCVIL